MQSHRFDLHTQSQIYIYICLTKCIHIMFFKSLSLDCTITVNFIQLLFCFFFGFIKSLSYHLSHQVKYQNVCEYFKFLPKHKICIIINAFETFLKLIWFVSLYFVHLNCNNVFGHQSNWISVFGYTEYFADTLHDKGGFKTQQLLFCYNAIYLNVSKNSVRACRIFFYSRLDHFIKCIDLWAYCQRQI